MHQIARPRLAWSGEPSACIIATHSWAWTNSKTAKAATERTSQPGWNCQWNEGSFDHCVATAAPRQARMIAGTPIATAIRRPRCAGWSEATDAPAEPTRCRKGVGSSLAMPVYQGLFAVTWRVSAAVT